MSRANKRQRLSSPPPTLSPPPPFIAVIRPAFDPRTPMLPRFGSTAAPIMPVFKVFIGKGWTLSDVNMVAMGGIEQELKALK